MKVMTTLTVLAALAASSVQIQRILDNARERRQGQEHGLSRTEPRTSVRSVGLRRWVVCALLRHQEFHQLDQLIVAAG